MVTEEKLAGWTGPSSATEQEKQERTERMIREAIDEHDGFDGYRSDFSIYAKGSYANNTNVKSDSDVDIVVECSDALYWEEHDPAKSGRPSGSTPYTGPWTPEKLREEIAAALEKKFPGSVTAGSTAFEVDASSARVNADVVPSFAYKLYFSDGTYRQGTKVFKKDGTSIVNYPKLQLELGKAKNVRTNGLYKKTVRILKRLENELVSKGLTEEIPSYLLECLVYNCREEYFSLSTWRATMQGCLADIYNYTMRAEPDSDRWLEANGAKYLFHHAQKWTRAQVHKFAGDAWDYMGFE
ncbi:nucleotidyltransferase domain-containing protein [Agromyces binzhouensis]|uniref:Nucleotidyltransferase n=1 Tax=Agromyces binzhouensis TaxID=1817495 RepID=A0A4Q2JX39_9MICO|nr:nucleotidyltransferase [Agromyces binzhouensis]RXZ51816.1 nucleotidyltransferase [Agromyces binzhouensis]